MLFGLRRKTNKQMPAIYGEGGKIVGYLGDGRDWKVALPHEAAPQDRTNEIIAALGGNNRGRVR